MIGNIKIDVNDEGKVILTVIGERAELASTGVDALIGELKKAQDDAKELLKITKRKVEIKKSYNGEGKEI
jgi:hypothetical protein